jgi:hypothetical protein
MPAERNRLTVFFRLLAAIPVLIVGIFYILAAFIAVVVAWFALVFTGSYPEGLYSFVRGVNQFAARMNGYIYLQTDVYPPFDTGEHPEYPIRLSIPEQAGEQSRVTVLLRIFLFIPVYIIQYAFSIAAELVAIAMWFAALFTGKSPEGLHNALTFLLGYSTRAVAYGCLLTDKWPPIAEDSSAPASTGSLSPPPPPPSSTAQTAQAEAAPPPPPPPPADDPPAGGPFGGS